MDYSRTLRVEGWRYIPHSYSVVNQFQLLVLSRTAGLHLTHRDMPYLKKSWQPVPGLFDPAQEALIRNIPQPTSSQPPDAVLRMTFPYNCHPLPKTRCVVFGTAEYGCVPKQFLAGFDSLAEVMSRTQLHFITPSNWSRAGFIGSGADPERVTVIPHGVDPEIFRPFAEEDRQRVRGEFGLTGFTFLTLGSLLENKGLGLLFKAFAEVARRYPQIQLVMKGLEALYPSLEMLKVQASGLTAADFQLVQERLVYAGKTFSFREMSDLYNAADVYVSPYSAEGFNLPVLEAAACGLPVICTAGGSTDDFTTGDFALRIESRRVPTQQHDSAGWMLEPSYDHLLAHMLFLVENSDFCRRAQMAGPMHVRSRWTWEQAAGQLLETLFPTSSGVGGSGTPSIEVNPIAALNPAPVPGSCGVESIGIDMDDLIDGDRFPALADYRYSNDDEACLAYLNGCQKPSVTLYADTHDAHRLMSLIRLFPRLAVTLITHNSDGGVRASDIRTQDADIRQLPRNVQRWYAQNIEAMDPRLIAIPIGLERVRWFPKVQKHGKILALGKQGLPKKNLLYVNHNVATNPAHRGPIYSLFQDRAWATCGFAANGVGYEEFLREIGQHHFTISPFGNGLDCHRTWEVLYAGGIPVVPRCYCHEKLYSDLPVLLVDSYEVLTEAFLREQLGLLAGRNLDKAKFSYYRDLIAAGAREAPLLSPRPPRGG